nr:zinc ribbon domain-containing protein [Ardenticatena sp.]
MTMEVFIVLILIAFLVAWTARPLMRRRFVSDASTPNPQLEELEALLFQREAVLHALRDLQFDRSMGKLSEEDFRQLDARYRAQAAAILKRLDELEQAVGGPSTDEDQALDEWIDQAIAALRQQRAAQAKTCTRCGAPLSLNARFCAQCGAPLGLSHVAERTSSGD